MEKTKETNHEMEAEKNSYSHILKYTGLLGGVQGLNMLVGIVRNKFTAMFLGPSGMGLLSLFNATSGFLTSATNLGIPTSGVRVVSEAEARNGVEQAISQVRTLSLLSALLGALVCALLGPLLNLFTFSWGNHTYHFVLLAPTIFFTILAGGETAILKGVGKLKSLAAQGFLLALLSLLVSVPVYGFFGESGILAVLFLLALAQWLLALSFSRKEHPFRLCLSRIQLLKAFPMIRLGLSFVLAGMMSSGAEFLVRAFLNQQGNLAEVGLFNSGITLVLVYGGMVFSVMETDYYPRLSAVRGEGSATSEAENRNLIVSRQLEMNLLLMGPVISAIILLLPFAIPLLYNREFLGVLGMTQIAAVGLLFKAFYMPLEYIPLSRGEARVFLVQESCCVVLLIVCEIIGYLLHGLDGLGAGIVVAYAVESIGVYVFCRIHYAYRLSFPSVQHLLVHVLNLLLLGCVVWLSEVDSWCYWLLGLFFCAASLLYSFSRIRRSLKEK